MNCFGVTSQTSLAPQNLERSAAMFLREPVSAPPKPQQHLVPSKGGIYNLGADNLPFNHVFLKTAPIVQSDVRKLTSIEHVDCKQALDFISSLTPLRYKHKEGNHNNHVGFSGQQVRGTMKQVFEDKEGEDYARVWTKSSDGTICTRPDELLALASAAIKQLNSQVQLLTTQNESLNKILLDSNVRINVIERVNKSLTENYALLKELILSNSRDIDKMIEGVVTPLPPVVVPPSIEELKKEELSRTASDATLIREPPVVVPPPPEVAKKPVGLPPHGPGSEKRNSLKRPLTKPSQQIVTKKRPTTALVSR